MLEILLCILITLCINYLNAYLYEKRGLYIAKELGLIIEKYGTEKPNQFFHKDIKQESKAILFFYIIISMLINSLLFSIVVNYPKNVAITIFITINIVVTITYIYISSFHSNIKNNVAFLLLKNHNDRFKHLFKVYDFKNIEEFSSRFQKTISKYENELDIVEKCKKMIPKDFKYVENKNFNMKELITKLEHHPDRCFKITEKGKNVKYNEFEFINNYVIVNGEKISFNTKPLAQYLFAQTINKKNLKINEF